MPSIKKPPPPEDVAATRAALERQESVRKMAEERYQFEQRVLTLCTSALVVLLVLWSVALSTDHWFELDPPPGGVYLRDSRTVLRDGHTGLWRLCSEQFHPTNLTAYESITTTIAPVSTTKRPRAQPCKWIGLRGRRRLRCRQLLINRFKNGLAARRRSLLRLNTAAANAANAAVAANATNATVLPTLPTPVQSPTDADGNVTDTDWLTTDFDDAVSAAEDSATAPDPVDEEVEQEPEDLEKEKILDMVEEEIKERIKDGVTDDHTINETLSEAILEKLDEITSVTFWECRVRDLSEDNLEPASSQWQMLSYMRTLVTFSVVSLLLWLLGFLSALYTFKEPRYTFKRLSAGIQFITCCGLLVVIQVFRSAAAYEQWTELAGVEMSVGYSQVLAWLSLSLQLLSSFFFLLYSRKKKRNKAPNEEVAMADEPTIIGR